MAAIIGGPILGLLAIAFTIYTSYFVHHAAHTTGTITEVRKRTGQDTSPEYALTFSFLASDGETITKQSSVSSNPPEFVAGQQVRVLFDAHAPQKAKIDAYWQLWLLPTVFGILCVVFTPMGFLLLRRPEVRTAQLPFWTETRYD